MFPAPLRAYNFTLTANPTSAIAGEAEFIEQHHTQHIRTIFIGLDWAIGMIYHAGGVQAQDMTPAATLTNFGASEVSWLRKMADALSLPKVINLGSALRAIATSGQPVTG
jgi:hypothetical protein